MSTRFLALALSFSLLACGGSDSDAGAASGGSGGVGSTTAAGGVGGGTSGSGGTVATGGASTGGTGGMAGSASGGAAGAATGGAAGTAGSGGSASKQSHPGHYIAMIGSDDDADVVDVLKPGVKGVQIRYTWRSLEPKKDQYAFQKLGHDLDLVAQHGATLIVLIEDKTFDGSMPTPDYLSAQTLPNKPGGYSVVRWDPTVRARFKALTQAIGAQFDQHSGLEALAIQESAHGLTDQQMSATGYTAELYRDTLIDLLKVTKQALPSSEVFWYMNFLPQKQAYIGDIAEAVAPLGVSMGGPDILPESFPLVSNTYPFYDQMQGKMKLFCSAQFDSYEHVNTSTGDVYTPEEIFEFSRDELHTSYVLWNHKTWSTPAGSYNYVDALPVIAKNPSFN